MPPLLAARIALEGEDPLAVRVLPERRPVAQPGALARIDHPERGLGLVEVDERARQQADRLPVREARAADVGVSHRCQVPVEQFVRQRPKPLQDPLVLPDLQPQRGLAQRRPDGRPDVRGSPSTGCREELGKRIGGPPRVIGHVKLPGAHPCQPGAEFEPEAGVRRDVEQLLRPGQPQVIRLAAAPQSLGSPVDAVGVRREDQVADRRRMRVPAVDGGDGLVDQPGEVTRRHEIVVQQVEDGDQQVADVAIRLGTAPRLGEQHVGGERLVPEFMSGRQPQDGVGREPPEQRIVGVGGLAPQLEYPALALIRAPVTRSPLSQDASTSVASPVSSGAVPARDDTNGAPYSTT